MKEVLLKMVLAALFPLSVTTLGTQNYDCQNDSECIPAFVCFGGHCTNPDDIDPSGGGGSGPGGGNQGGGGSEVFPDNFHFTGIYCTSDADCPNGMYCYGEKNECYVISEVTPTDIVCVDTPDCPAGMYCEASEHRCYIIEQ